MGFFPSAGNLGIPMRVWDMADDDITPEWQKEVRAGSLVLPTSAALRALVVAAAAFGVVRTYQQVVGDASAGVDDLIVDIQHWLKTKRVDQGFARKQKRPRDKPAAPAPIRDGESYEDSVLRALDELEEIPDLPDPGYQDEQLPFEPVGPTRNGDDRSFTGWLERRYPRRSVNRYMRRRY